MQLTAFFKAEKDTKNTVRYQEDTNADHPPIMGVAYIQKWALKKLGGGNAPRHIKITVEVEE